MNKIVAIATMTAVPLSIVKAQPGSAAIDPVYVEIETHRALSIAYESAVNHPAVGDHRHPENTKKELTSDRASDDLMRQAERLFAFKPSTPAGVGSLLRYIATLDVWQMPGCFGEPDEIEGMKDLCRSAGSSLEDVGAGPRVDSTLRSTPAAVATVSPGEEKRDPIFAVIEAHRKSWAAVKAGEDANVSEAKSNSLCKKECKAMDRIAETVPLTLNGLFAMLSYIGVAIEQQGDAQLVFGDDATAVFTSMAKAAKTLSVAQV